jgi:hypothetical protein
VGHDEGVYEDAGEALAVALRTARNRTPWHLLENWGYVAGAVPAALRD